MKTAVEWLIGQIKGYESDCEIFQQAKEMEEEQRGYSEEEVKNIVDQTIEKFYKHRYADKTKAEMKELWFEQFKKK
jgi:hypothetical protein